MRTVSALFDSLETARTAVQDLVDNGFQRDDISLIASDPQGDYGRYVGEPAYTEDVKAGEGAGFGALVGGVTGLLIGLGTLAIPGIGPVIAAGPLIAGLTGAGVGVAAGAVTGGLTAALIKMGVPEDEADVYAEGVRQGRTLVSVNVDDTWAATATQILDRHSPVSMEGRVDAPYSGTQSTSGTRVEDFEMDDDTLGPEEVRRDYEMPIGGTSERDVNTYASPVSTTDTAYTVPKGYDTYDPDFQTHYQTTYATLGMPYTFYSPAYMYGYTLANDRRYYGSDWTTIESEARREWEARDADTPWEQIKDAVRHAWDRVRGYR